MMKRILDPDEFAAASIPPPPSDDEVLDFRRWLARVQADLRVDPRRAGAERTAAGAGDATESPTRRCDPGLTR